MKFIKYSISPDKLQLYFKMAYVSSYISNTTSQPPPIPPPKLNIINLK